MKTTMKKVLSMVMALVLLLGVLPMAAMATEAHTHVDENQNGICDVGDCQFDMNTCGVNNHAWDQNDCTKNRQCTRPNCGATEAAKLHTDATWKTNDGYHWHECTVCGAGMFDAGEHGGGTATCKEKAVCTVCNTAYGALSTEHTGGTATCKAKAVCTTCGQAYGDLNPDGHTWTTATCTAPRTCTACGVTEENSMANHTWVGPTCTTPQTCSVCGTTGTPASGHTWNNATCINAKICTVCGTTEGTALGHDFSGNATSCNRCQTAVNAVPKYTVYYNLNVDEDSNVNHKLDSYYVGTSMSTVLRDLGLVNVQFTGQFRDWFYLEGWYLNGVKVTGNETLQSDVTLVAKWVQKYNYEVILKLYTNGNTNNVVKVLDVFDYVQDDGKISHTEVTAIAKQYIESNNDAPITIYGPFDANGWERYSLYSNRLTNTEYVEVNPYGTTVVHAMVHNAKIYNGTSSSGSVADSTNPKTGDMIMMPAAVLGLSVSALAVMFYLKKKRAF